MREKGLTMSRSSALSKSKDAGWKEHDLNLVGCWWRMREMAMWWLKATENGQHRVLSGCQPTAADCGGGLRVWDFLGEPCLNRHCFLGLSYMPLGPPDPEVPPAGQPSETESGPSLGKDTSWQRKADKLYPHPSIQVHSAQVCREVPSVQLILQMLHLEWSAPKPFSSSLQTRAQDPAVPCLPSSPWGL